MDINQKIVELRETSDHSYKEIAQLINDLYGVSLTANAIKKRYRYWSKQPNKEPAEAITTLDEFLSVTDVDTEKWRVRNWTANKWGNNWQVKASFERRPSADVVEVMQQVLDNIGPVPQYPKLPEVDPQLQALLELTIFDLHFGKLANYNGERYNIQIAKRLYRNAVIYLLNRFRGFGVGRILLPIGNDLFHVDSPNNMTTRGTTMENVDGTYYDHYVQVVDMIRHTIDLCANVAPTDVLVIPGNHDGLTTFHLGVLLDILYKGNDRIYVNAVPESRKYYRYGKNLVGFTHGNEIKRTELPLLMASEVSESWGKTKYREWHTGHWHTKAEFAPELTEKKGIRIREIPSLCGSDDWHVNNGYVQNVRSAEAYLWHKQYGFLDMSSAPVALLQNL